ncbi:ATP-binding protein [Alicyclobacillus dauci]|uniref:histidine kinase n=1 Tax=Alicyclobacillus dauci TaxID=1475485 RepID=A0ABY6Z279_9BACL|nr:ATP-binding protein [Alicyclobacillus dauci]WAH36389.1 ATP-binding protein [Alicyclobacillus dauci]
MSIATQASNTTLSTSQHSLLFPQHVDDRRCPSNIKQPVRNLKERLDDCSEICGIARNFFSDFPGTSPFAALILDTDNVILETLTPHGGLSGSIGSQIRPGFIFEPAYDLAVVPFLDQADVPVEVGVHGLSKDWHAAMIGMKHPTIPSRDAKIVLVAKEPVSASTVVQVTATSAHAIVQLWLTSNRQQEAHREAEHIKALRKLEEKLQEFEKTSSLASLSAGIAHEIRNPLTTARGFLQLFEQRCEPADRDFVELTIRELDRIQLLLEDFMGMSRPDNESLTQVDVRDLTSSVYQFLRPEASLCGVELAYDVPADPVHAVLQSSRIKQVLMNLMQNAVHACDKFGRVILRLEDYEDHIVITISDNGCGIADLHQLFHPFHTTKKAGTGLGMFVSKHIIEEHRGHIQVDSVLNEGTTVSVYLPRLSG